MLCVTVAAVVRAAELPKPAGPVSDFAGVLNANVHTELTSLIREIEQITTAEIAVATVNALEGMTVEEYANRLFQEWGVGRKAVDNGVLVLVAPKERTMRIEVGYGLEPILPDGLAGEIIRTDFLPAFKNNDYNLGILTGVRHIARIVRDGQPVSPEERRRLMEAEQGDGRPPAWLLIPFLGIFVASGSLGFGIALRTRTVIPAVVGALVAGLPLLISLATFFAPSALVHLPLAAGMTLVGYRKGRSQYWQDTLRNSRGSAATQDDGWVSGGDETTSSGSSDTGSSSDSFGGGSSGGGGASGSW